MENVFKEIGHGVEVVGKDIAHVVVEAVEYPAKAVKVIETVTKEYPVLKPVLITVAQDGAKIGGDLLAAVADKGLNWKDDLSLVADVEAFFKFIQESLVPQVEAVYGELNSDVA